MRFSFIIAAMVLALASSPAILAKDQLPPGLQKKAAKGQQLPPGWQKKLKKGAVLDKVVFDAGVEVQAPIPTPEGGITIKVDDRLLQLDPITRKILDILN